MKIAFTTLGCPEWDLSTIIERAKQYGYDGVDFRGYAGEMAVYKLTEFSSGADETADRFADAGVEVAAFSSSARMFNEDAGAVKGHIEEVRRYAELCGKFSSSYIRVFGGRMGDTPVEKAIDASVEALEKMAAAASPIVIAVETHDAWMDSALLPKVMDRVAASNVGVLWDVHHPYRFIGETPQQTYDNIGRYTCYTHIKDSRPTPDGKFEYTLPGEGDVPLAEIISLLKRGGYDGYLALEWEKKWHPEIAEPEVALPAYAEFLRKLAT